jgi:hypothetical protein
MKSAAEMDTYIFIRAHRSDEGGIDHIEQHEFNSNTVFPFKMSSVTQHMN